MAENVIQSLLSSSLFIERLWVIDSQHLHQLEVTASNLRYLDIRRCKNLEYLKVYAPNLNVMKLHTVAAHPSLIRLKVYAPNLSRVSVVFDKKLSMPVPMNMSDCLQELLAQFSQVKKRLSFKIFPAVSTHCYVYFLILVPVLCFCFSFLSLFLKAVTLVVYNLATSNVGLFFVNTV